jgi:hypothetical protein
MSVIKKQDVLATCFMLVSCFGLFFDPEGGGDMFLRNVTNGLHGVISKKIERTLQKKCSS